MATDTSDIELTAQCLCGAQTFTTNVPRSSLPLTATFCHCTSCRHLTGGMHSTGMEWPGAADDIAKAPLEEYVFSPRLTLLFCGTCSSPMFWRGRVEGEADTYEAFTGVLSNNPVPGLVRVKEHIFVGDTLDGGVAVWQRHLARGDGDARDAPIPCFGGWGHRGEELDPDTLSAKNADAIPDEIPFHCRCRGVDLVLRRGTADFAAMDPSELPWFVEPVTHKLLAGFDACDSCRKTSGVDVFNWTFTLLRHVDYPGGGGFPRTTPALRAAVGSPNRDPRLGTLAMYASSADVQRYFCSRCSASVFYAVDSRQDMVDLAAGLLDAPDGSRAESILAWAHALMVWSDDVKGGWKEELVDAMKRNSEAWRVDRGVPRNWAVIAREERDAKAKAVAAAKS